MVKKLSLGEIVLRLAIILLVVVLLALVALVATIGGALLTTFTEDSDPYGNNSNTDTK